MNRIITYIFTFVLIFVGTMRYGKFSAEFKTKQACESALKDLEIGIKKSWGGVIILGCYPKGDSYNDL